MLIQSVLKAATPYLQHRKVKDVVIGISLIAVELDNGDVAVSYVLREGLKAGCSIFPYGQNIIGQDAADIVNWIVSGEDDLQKGIGMAVLCAASRAQNLEDCQTPGKPFGVTVKDTDTVGMIGFISGVAKIMSSLSKKLYIFDKGISQSGGTKGPVLPMEDQPRLLPKCDIVLASGTTIVNGSIDGILKMCSNAREIIIIGPSTPMFPKAFMDSKVTVLAGSWWKNQHKDTIFKKISLASGISELREFAIKKSVRVGL